MRDLCDNCGDEVKIPSSENTAIKEDGNATILCNDCKNSEKRKFTVYGQELIERYARASGNSAVVPVPVGWTGKRIVVIRMD